MDQHGGVSTAETIRGAGLRSTLPRRAVLEVLRERPHVRADDVLTRVLTKVPGTSLQSVYNVLGDFTDAGLVRRIEPAGHPMLFELRVDDNHHHLICTECGAVEDVDCAAGHTPCLTPLDAHGFQIAAAEVTFWGVCPRCTAA